MSSRDDVLPLPRPLLNSGYSLETDMMFGWRPIRSQSKPVSLTYNNGIPGPKSFSGEDFPLIYKGFRASDSFSIHKILSTASENSYFYDFEAPETQSFGYQSKDLPNTSQESGMLIQDQLIFDSKFECGNLDKVYKIAENEYDLYMRSDTNTMGHLHWFYFSVTGIQQDITVKFNIVNFSRSSSLYRGGMKIRTYSVKRTKQNLANGWEPAGENVKFSHSKLNEQKVSRNFFELSFKYNFTIGDKVWFATTIPYTLCRLQKVLKSISQDEFYNEPEHINCKILCKSMSMLDIPLIEVTNPQIENELKKSILIIGRVHPAETVSSWVAEGFLRFICSRHPEAVYLRNKFFFHVIPMINVDGVVAGNSRTCMSGNDLNRWYHDPDESLHKGLIAVRGLAKSLTERFEAPLEMFFDIHGHFCRKGSFVYGPHFPLHSVQYFTSKIIPKLLSERTEIFRYHSSRFAPETTKPGAARIVMSKEFGIELSYTLENSYFGYIDSYRESHHFSILDLCTVGEKLARSICEFSILTSEEQKFQKVRAKIRNKKRGSNTEESETESEENGSAVTPGEKIISLKYDKEPIKRRNIEEIIEELKNDDRNKQDSEEEDSGSDDDNNGIQGLEIRGVSTLKTDEIKLPAVSVYQLDRSQRHRKSLSTAAEKEFTLELEKTVTFQKSGLPDKKIKKIFKEHKWENVKATESIEIEKGSPEFYGTPSSICNFIKVEAYSGNKEPITSPPSWRHKRLEPKFFNRNRVKVFENDSKEFLADEKTRYDIYVPREARGPTGFKFSVKDKKLTSSINSYDIYSTKTNR